MNELNVPRGRFASNDDAELQRMMAEESAKRKNLAERLKDKAKGGEGKIVVGKGPDKLEVNKGVLANDAELQRMMAEESAKRKNLAERLKDKAKGGDGKIAVGKGENKLEVGKGVLAAQWYEKNPLLLEGEKFAMSKSPYHDFELFKLGDGRLAWKGELSTDLIDNRNFGIYESKFRIPRSYLVWAVYQNNHPEQRMGSSIFIYPVSPTVEDFENELGFTPYHLLRDSANNRYLCTTTAEGVKTGTTKTTAAAVLTMALRWLSAYELVLTGELTKEDFQTHGVI